MKLAIQRKMSNEKSICFDGEAGAADAALFLEMQRRFDAALLSPEFIINI